MSSLEKDIFEYLSENLSPKRFEHSYCVSVFAVKLARIYGADILKVRTAALLHDCAKGMSGEDLVVFLKKDKAGIEYFKETAKNSPLLLHSYAGEKIIKKIFNINDKDILLPVRYHTLGRPAMSLYEKILFTADAVSRDRKYKGVSRIRKKACVDLDSALAAVLYNKISYVLKAGLWLCPQTVDTWNYYAQKN